MLRTRSTQQKTHIYFIFFSRMKWKYAFVTFEHPADAYKVIDTSTKNPALRAYDISFGGRRAFCREKYLDLGNALIQQIHLSFSKLLSNFVFFEQITLKMIIRNRCIRWRESRNTKRTHSRRFYAKSRKNCKKQKNEHARRAALHTDLC